MPCYGRFLTYGRVSALDRGREGSYGKALWSAETRDGGAQCRHARLRRFCKRIGAGRRNSGGGGEGFGWPNGRSRFRRSAALVSRGADSGRIDSPFVLSDVQLEQGSRGPVTLTGRHGAAAHVWVLGPGNWGLTVRPLFTPELQEIYEEERRAFESGQSGGAAEQWRVVAAQTRDAALADWMTLRQHVNITVETITQQQAKIPAQKIVGRIYN
jgi:hypothetical protein